MVCPTRKHAKRLMQVRDQITKINEIDTSTYIIVIFELSVYYTQCDTLGYYILAIYAYIH